MKIYKIASIAGEGIGTDVLPVSLKVLKEETNTIKNLIEKTLSIKKNKTKNFKKIGTPFTVQKLY